MVSSKILGSKSVENYQFEVESFRDRVWVGLRLADFPQQLSLSTLTFKDFQFNHVDMNWTNALPIWTFSSRRSDFKVFISDKVFFVTKLSGVLKDCQIFARRSEMRKFWKAVDKFRKPWILGWLLPFSDPVLCVLRLLCLAQAAMRRLTLCTHVCLHNPSYVAPRFYSARAGPPWHTITILV